MSGDQDISMGIRGTNKPANPVFPVVYIEHSMQINVLLHHMLIILYTL